MSESVRLPEQAGMFSRTLEQIPSERERDAVCRILEYPWKYHPANDVAILVACQRVREVPAKLRQMAKQVRVEGPWLVGPRLSRSRERAVLRGIFACRVVFRKLRRIANIRLLTLSELRGVQQAYRLHQQLQRLLIASYHQPFARVSVSVYRQYCREVPEARRVCDLQDLSQECVANLLSLLDTIKLTSPWAFARLRPSCSTVEVWLDRQVSYWLGRHYELSSACRQDAYDQSERFYADDRWQRMQADPIREAKLRELRERLDWLLLEDPVQRIPPLRVSLNSSYRKPEDRHRVRQIRNRRFSAIASHRWLAGSPATLQALGASFGITKEVVRGIEKRLEWALRKHLETTDWRNADVFE